MVQRSLAGMLDKGQTISVAYGEMLRFSVAISVQQVRISECREKLREGRVEQKAASERALYDVASVPTDRLEEHLRSLQAEHELPPKMHLKSEIQFLLIAVHGVGEMARTIRSVAKDDDQLVRCVQAALTTFEKLGPEAKHLRNLHEHLGQALLGKGDALKKLPDQNLDGAIALLEEDVAYVIGGKVWKLGDLAVAAKDLVRDVTSCLND